MLISCPSCSTSYDVDPAGLGEQGKTVRCSNCGH
ncbi:MAG: zinc-ribbon domain-containing protein, partial [Proteobacteria bacterium]|nr:zinc-ribbon domain-containing protein [Pseudomonadota bacterium]